MTFTSTEVLITLSYVFVLSKFIHIKGCGISHSYYSSNYSILPWNVFQMGMDI